MKKRLTLAACLAVVLAAPAALAQASTPTGAELPLISAPVALAALDAAPAVLAQASTSAVLLDALLTPTNVGIALGAVVGILGFFGGGVWLTARRKRIVATVAFHAFHVVEDIAAMDEEENLIDKAAKGLEVADSWLKANGWRPLKPWEQEAVKLEFASIHGAQKADVKARAEALELALGAIGSAAALSPVATAAVASVP
ncbi:hypothetical protein HMI49_03955 [Corallococcus exercitus]|uniref:Uncharacterized protein n=1 Tax=Corallococcus exercitus TaxID=2316736 RepID=A0A7Y4KFJ8_9BACT|nr:hypothetical protein [Corallococcus exercitus]NOK32355.1 hypothetical protein [Corallococcus exercitus]